MNDFFADRRPHEGLTYDAYRQAWEEQKDRSPGPAMDKEERKMLHYLKYNWRRQAEVHRAYEPSDDLKQSMKAIDEPQIWMVITEPWCGDSAFLLPVVAEAAEASDQVTLRILHRDENLDIMDQYLTDGSRSIPKLVVFDADGEEVFQWGPRPSEATDHYAEIREQDLPKEQQIQQLIEYYEDGGWQEVDEELAAAVSASATAAA